VNVKFELILTARAFLALIVGGFMGWDRRHIRPAAGIRTYAAVSLGACVFGSLSLQMSEPSEKARIAAQVVSGIGFLGAGVIFREQGKIAGLTTAATLWAAAAVGLSIAFELYLLGLVTALLLFGLLEIHHLRGWAFSQNENPQQDERDANPLVVKPPEKRNGLNVQ